MNPDEFDVKAKDIWAECEAYWAGMVSGNRDEVIALIRTSLRQEYERGLAEDVFYNNGTLPIIVVSKWSKDPIGGPAQIETQSMIMPGAGIKLSVVGLFRTLKKGEP